MKHLKKMYQWKDDYDKNSTIKGGIKNEKI